MDLVGVGPTLVDLVGICFNHFYLATEIQFEVIHLLQCFFICVKYIGMEELDLYTEDCRRTSRDLFKR